MFGSPVFHISYAVVFSKSWVILGCLSVFIKEGLQQQPLPGCTLDQWTSVSGGSGGGAWASSDFKFPGDLKA